MQEYNVKPIGKTCAATGKDLVPGSVCHSVLMEKNGELLRLDFSHTGWVGPPAGAIARWCCIVPDAQAAKKKPLDPQELMRQFELLCEEANPAHDQHRYVLALLLMQRRRLKLEGTQSIDGQAHLELTGLRGEGTFWVPDQSLNDADVQALQQSLFPVGAAA